MTIGEWLQPEANSTFSWGTAVGGFLLGALGGDLGLLNTIDYLCPFWGAVKLGAPKVTCQSQLEEIYAGADWMIYLRYQFVLKFLVIAFVMSQVVHPNLLVLICSLCFFQSFMIERRGMARLYKKPPLYSDYMQSIVVVYIMPVILILHVVFSVTIYSNTFMRVSVVTYVFLSLTALFVLVFCIIWFVKPNILAVERVYGKKISRYGMTDLKVYNDDTGGTGGLSFSKLLNAKKSGNLKQLTEK